MHRAKIEELSTTIATGEKDLASATEIREKEKADFDKLEKELMEAVRLLSLFSCRVHDRFALSHLLAASFHS